MINHTETTIEFSSLESEEFCTISEGLSDIEDTSDSTEECSVSRRRYHVISSSFYWGEVD